MRVFDSLRIKLTRGFDVERSWADAAVGVPGPDCVDDCTEYAGEATRKQTMAISELEICSIVSRIPTGNLQKETGERKSAPLL